MVLCDPSARFRGLTGQRHDRSHFRAQRAEFEKCTARAAAVVCAARLSAMDGALLEGAYSLWVRELLRALPGNQLRLLRSEDLQRNPAGTAHEALAFLGLQAHPAVEKAAASTMVTQSVTTSSGSDGDSSHGSVPAFYAKFNTELAHLTDGDERFFQHV